MSDDLSGDMLAPSWPNLVELCVSDPVAMSVLCISIYVFQVLPVKLMPEVHQEDCSLHLSTCMFSHTWSNSAGLAKIIIRVVCCIWWKT